MSYWNAESALQEEYQIRVKRRGRLYTAIQILCILTSAILVIYPIVDWTLNIRPPYHEAIGQHVDKAMKNYEHPEVVRVYITQAMDGIAKLGLKPTDNSALYNNLPERKVTQQYVIFEAIIQRCDDIIQWRQENLVNFDFRLYETYITKLDDLYNYMYNFDEGGMLARDPDWISFGAYLNKTKYPFLYRMAIFQMIWVAVSAYTVYYLKKKKLYVPEIVREQIRRETNVRV